MRFTAFLIALLVGVSYSTAVADGSSFEEDRKAAEQGNAAAQYELGDMYYWGQGVPRDYTEAMKWYRKAAEQGFAAAQYELGVMLMYILAHLTRLGEQNPLEDLATTSNCGFLKN